MQVFLPSTSPALTSKCARKDSALPVCAQRPPATFAREQPPVRQTTAAIATANRSPEPRLTTRFLYDQPCNQGQFECQAARPGSLKSAETSSEHTPSPLHTPPLAFQQKPHQHRTPFRQQPANPQSSQKGTQPSAAPQVPDCHFYPHRRRPDGIGSQKTRKNTFFSNLSDCGMRRALVFQHQRCWHPGAGPVQSLRRCQSTLFGQRFWLFHLSLSRAFLTGLGTLSEGHVSWLFPEKKSSASTWEQQIPWCRSWKAASLA